MRQLSGQDADRAAARRVAAEHTAVERPAADPARWPDVARVPRPAARTAIG